MYRGRLARIVRAAIIGLAALDTGGLFLNVFTEFAVSYAPTTNSMAPYSYVMKGPYYGHLAFTYGLVVLVVVILAVKSLHTPRIYRAQYLSIITAIAAVVNNASNFLDLFFIFHTSI